MNDSPNCVCENIRTAFGRPLSPISSGIVTCFSTSSAAWPGKSVMTVTWMSVTSGKASTGSDLNAAMPAADEQDQQHHDQQRLVERRGDDAANHGRGASASSCRSSSTPSVTMWSPAERPDTTRSRSEPIATVSMPRRTNSGESARACT